MPADRSKPAQSSQGAQPGAGEGWRALEAPWRQRYLEGLKDADSGGGAVGAAGGAAGGQADGGASASSFLREYWLRPEDDGRNHVILRTAAGMVLLNRYPYANGHLLVALGEGRARLLDYEPGQRAELWLLVEAATALVERAVGPQGVNVGVNQGRAAGAGVPGHLHVHVVPRWSGDTNFMTSVAGVRVTGSSLDGVASRMREAWAALRGG